MKQYPGNAPVRHLTCCKSTVFKLWLVAFAVLSMMAFTHTTFAALTVKFDQSAYKGTVWIQVQKATTDIFTATYANVTKSIDFTNGTDTVLMSKPVKLSDIGAGGLNITWADSSKIYVFYDDPAGNDRTVAPDHNSPNFPQRYQDVELAMRGNAADYGDLTYINWYSAPLSIRSYDASQNPLQQAGFGSATGTEIAAQMAAASGGNPNAVMKDAKGNILRYLGPSNNFINKGGNPWPSFIPYTQSVNKANQSTKIKSNPQGFHFDGQVDPAYMFGADMTATVSADGSITITGKITASNTGTIKTGNPALPTGGAWTGATFSFAATDPTFNQAIYGQVWDGYSAVSFTGQAWTDFQTFCHDTLKDPTQAHDPITNPNLLDAGGMFAYHTVLDNFVGEVTTGLLGGFINSDYQVGSPPVAIKSMDSKQWWSLTPMVAFSQLQPLHNYFNTYAAIIFFQTANTVYSIPYGDRFKSNPAVFTVKYTDPTTKVTSDVASWVVGIGAPIPHETVTGMVELLLLDD